MCTTIKDCILSLSSLQDEQKCIETVELENYDRCQELRALLKRKNRFLLIRSSGKKVGLSFSLP